MPAGEKINFADQINENDCSRRNDGVGGVEGAV